MSYRNLSVAGPELTTVLSGFTYLECPRWHDGRLWAVDFYTMRVISALEDGSDVRTEAEIPQRPSGLGWMPDGRLLVVSMLDQTVMRREHDGTVVLHADLSGLIRGPANDMVVDERGRAYVGGFGFELSSGVIETTDLVLVEPDGTARAVASEFWFPNGMAITDDQTLLVNESFGNRVSGFAIGDDGSLGERRDWAKFAELPDTCDLLVAHEQMPVAADGGCLDAEGCLWVADGTHNRLLRVAQGGEIRDEVHLDSGAFACMLGGADGRTLFICSAPDYFEDARSQALEGTMLALGVEVPRAGRP